MQKVIYPTTLITPSKLQRILAELKKSLQHTNPDYTLVLERLHLYYNLQLVTFDINRNMNLVIQFLVFIQPYIQKPLVLYQLETVPVPNTGQQDRSPILHPPACQQTLLCLKFRNIHITYTSRAEVMQNDR